MMTPFLLTLANLTPPYSPPAPFLESLRDFLLRPQFSAGYAVSYAIFLLAIFLLVVLSFKLLLKKVWRNIVLYELTFLITGVVLMIFSVVEINRISNRCISSFSGPNFVTADCGGGRSYSSALVPLYTGTSFIMIFLLLKVVSRFYRKK